MIAAFCSLVRQAAWHHTAVCSLSPMWMRERIGGKIECVGWDKNYLQKRKWEKFWCLYIYQKLYITPMFVHMYIIYVIYYTHNIYMLWPDTQQLSNISAVNTVVAETMTQPKYLQPLQCKASVNININIRQNNVLLCLVILSR